MVLRTLFGTPGFVPVILGVAFVSMGIGIMGTFLHPFLVRHFRVGVGDAAAYFGISSAIAVTIGLAWSGFGTSWLGRRGLHWNCILPSVGVMLATPLYLSSWKADSAFATMVFVTLASLFSISYNTPLLALFQNIVEPRMRATAAAIFFCTGTLIGHGLGPVIFGMFSDTLTQSAFTHGSYDVLCSTRPDLAAPCLDASAAGLRGAGILVGVFTGTASVLFALAAFKFRSISEYTSK